MYVSSAPDYTVDCNELIWGKYTDIVISYMHMNQFAYVAFEGHISFGTYMVMTCFLSYGAYGAINDTNTFLMLRWLFQGNIWLFVLVLVLVLA